MVPLLKHQVERALGTHATPVPPAARVLDVGCGEQPFRRHLEGLGFRYTGLDVVQNAGETVDIVCSIDEPLPPAVQGLAFDLVVCVEVLEHVADWPQAFSNLAAVLRPWFETRTLDEIRCAFSDTGVSWGAYQTFSELVREDPRCSTDNEMWELVEHPGVEADRA